MNSQQLIEKLTELGFTPEDYKDQLYPHGSYYDDKNNKFENDDIRAIVGNWEEIKEEKVEKPRNFYDDSPEEQDSVLLNFIDEGIYLRAYSFSGSYGSETWTEWYEVIPETKTITVYKRVGEEESDSSY